MNKQRRTNEVLNEYMLKMQDIKVENFDINISNLVDTDALDKCLKLNWGLF